MKRPDPVQVALAQAQALCDTMLAAPGPELAFMASRLVLPLICELRALAGLLPCAEVETDDFEAGFQAFRVLYPVKCAWAAVRAACLRKSKMAAWPGWAAILAAVRAQLASERWRAGTIPNPLTWINGGRWDDDPATMRAFGRDAEMLRELRCPGEGAEAPPFDVDARLRRLADASNGFRSRVLSITAREVAVVEGELAVLDRLMIAEAAELLTDDGWTEIETAVQRTVNGLRRRLPAEQLARTRDRLRVQIIRQRAGLPVLSLHSPEAEP